MLARLRSASQICGCMYLRNHGVAQSRQFFSLSPEVKNRVKPKQKGSTRGYQGVGVQALEEGQPGDLKEIFQCGPEPARVRPNAWPEDMPEFRQVLLAFLDAAKASCEEMKADWKFNRRKEAGSPHPLSPAPPSSTPAT